MKQERRPIGERRLLALVLGVIEVLAVEPLAAAEFVDDAERRVALPEGVSRVFAAGAPAELLLYTLVPEMLVGRNHQPSPPCPRR